VGIEHWFLVLEAMAASTAEIRHGKRRSTYDRDFGDIQDRAEEHRDRDDDLD
jgi:hypothetical protein